MKNIANYHLKKAIHQRVLYFLSLHDFQRNVQVTLYMCILLPIKIMFQFSQKAHLLNEDPYVESVIMYAAGQWSFRVSLHNYACCCLIWLWL